MEAIYRGKKKGKTNEKKCVRRIYGLLLCLLSADRPLDDSTRLTWAREKKTALQGACTSTKVGGMGERVKGKDGRMEEWGEMASEVLQAGISKRRCMGVNEKEKERALRLCLGPRIEEYGIYFAQLGRLEGKGGTPAQALEKHAAVGQEFCLLQAQSP